MKQANIEAMARDLFANTPPSPYKRQEVAMNIASQLTETIEQLVQHLEDNPDWWETEVVSENTNQS